MRLPRLKSRQMIQALKKVGFVEARQTGSHLFLVNHETRKITSVPIHAKELKHGLVMAIIKQSGLTTSQFKKLL